MSFDEQPDGDLHGECAAEIHRLEAIVKSLRADIEAAWTTNRAIDKARMDDREKLSATIGRLRGELEVIAVADPSKWDKEVRDQFQQWAQNRARHAIASSL